MQRTKKIVNKYVDMEAEVDNDDDDEEEEEDKEILQSFIDNDDPSLETSDARRTTMAGHQMLDRKQDAIIDQDAEAVARRLKERYARPTTRYIGDADQVPQRLLMPSVKDAFLWQIRVKVRALHQFAFCQISHLAFSPAARKTSCSVSCVNSSTRNTLHTLSTSTRPFTATLSLA